MHCLYGGSLSGQKWDKDGCRIFNDRSSLEGVYSYCINLSKIYRNNLGYPFSTRSERINPKRINFKMKKYVKYFSKYKIYTLFYKNLKTCIWRWCHWFLFTSILKYIEECKCTINIFCVHVPFSLNQEVNLIMFRETAFSRKSRWDSSESVVKSVYPNKIFRTQRAVHMFTNPLVSTTFPSSQYTIHDTKTIWVKRKFRIRENITSDESYIFNCS